MVLVFSMSHDNLSHDNLLDENFTKMSVSVNSEISLMC